MALVVNNVIFQQLHAFLSIFTWWYLGSPSSLCCSRHFSNDWQYIAHCTHEDFCSHTHTHSHSFIYLGQSNGILLFWLPFSRFRKWKLQILCCRKKCGNNSFWSHSRISLCGSSLSSFFTIVDRKVASKVVICLAQCASRTCTPFD